MDATVAAAYQSPTQRARVLTEHWVHQNCFCPNCGNSRLELQPANSPVCDFRCPECKEEFELKSKSGTLGASIRAGAYNAMINRLTSPSNPSLFLLTYNKIQLEVTTLLVIPKHFFVTTLIEKREPLSPDKKRAGWIGCKILLDKIPILGKVQIVHNGTEVDKKEVLRAWQKTLFVRHMFPCSSQAKGWLLDVMRIVEGLRRTEFGLDDMYAFEHELKLLYPANRHIRDKIRQQLQILRDQGYLEFTSRGKYRLKEHPQAFPEVNPETSSP